MKIVQIDPNNPDPAVIHEAAEIIRAGGMVIYPSDTTYGVGVDPGNAIAMARLRRFKQRDLEKGISLLVPNLDVAKTLAKIDDRTLPILQKHLPGRFTFLLVNTNFTYCSLSSVAIRIADHRLMQALADAVGGPVTTTSANFSGEPPAYSVPELEDSLLNPERLTELPDLVLDGGELPRRPPSTLVDLTESPPKILRQGSGDFAWP